MRDWVGLAPDGPRVESFGVGWTKPFQKCGQFGETLLDRVLCVLGAVAFSQAPEFMQQYLQRLGGHLDEATRQLREFELVAKQSARTVREFADYAQAAADPVLARLGDVVAGSITRVDALSTAETALRTATPWSRPGLFLEHLDMEIARATWGVFKPAVPTTLEGALYAAAGMIVFLVLYHGLVKAPVVALARRVRGRKDGMGQPRTTAA